MQMIVFSISIARDEKRNVETFRQVAAIWLASAGLKLNEGKTEVLYVRRDFRKEGIIELRLVDKDIGVICHLKTLGMSFDASLSFKDHIARTVSLCNHKLRQISSIKRFLNMECRKTLVVMTVNKLQASKNREFVDLNDNTVKVDRID